MSKQISANVVAGNGVYDADAKTLILRETVEVITTDGMFIRLEGADVDLENGTLITNSPITATSPQADISSSTLHVEENGDRLIFDGNVRMTLKPGANKNSNGNSNE